MHASRIVFGIAIAALAFSPAPAQNANQNWVTAWGTSQQGLSETKISNATVRMVARVTIPGDTVRVRLDNSFGKAPVVFAHASIGPRVRGPALARGLIRTVMFGGKNTVTIPAGMAMVMVKVKAIPSDSATRLSRRWHYWQQALHWAGHSRATSEQQVIPNRESR